MFRVVLLLLGLVSLGASVADWNAYKALYGKQYDDPDEDARRQAIYESQYQIVEDWNADLSRPFIMAVNRFSDETLEEVKTRRTGLLKSDLPSTGQVFSLNTPMADSYQSIMTRFLLGPRDQGQCGSAWAFAAIQALEYQAYMYSGKKKIFVLSQQQLVDCDTNNYGCNGGSFKEAYTYMSSGVQSRTSYPYTSGSSGSANTCLESSDKIVVITRPSTYPSYTESTYGYDYGSFVAIPDNGLGDMDETFVNLTIALLSEVGPLSIGMCVNDAFRSYSSGIYDNSGIYCSDNDTNHAVLLVGYNRSSSDPNKHYWIIMNQWGMDWGWNGYINIQMGSGLIRDAMYPVVDETFTTTANPGAETSAGSSTTTAKTTSTTGMTTKNSTAKTTTKTTAKTTIKTTPKTTKKLTTSKTTKKLTTVKTTPKKTTTKTTPKKTTTKTTPKKTTTKTTPKKTTTKTTPKKTTTKTTPKKTTTKTTPKKTTTKTTPKKTTTKITTKTTPKKTSVKTTTKSTRKITTVKTTTKSTPKTTLKTTVKSTSKLTTKTNPSTTTTQSTTTTTMTTTTTATTTNTETSTTAFFTDETSSTTTDYTTSTTAAWFF